MRIKSSDILNFSYCPYSWKNRITIPISFRQFNIFESSIVKSILTAEEKCLLNNLEINNRNILRQWDKIWWPKAAANNIPISEIESESIKAAILFKDYTKYNFTDYLYQTVGVNIISETYINNSILTSKVDILKVDLNNKHKNLNIICFGNKKISETELFLSPYVWSTILPYHNKTDEINFTYVGILNNRDKLYATSCYFRNESLQKISKYIKYYIDGMKQNIDYMNITKCNECKQCKNFKYLTKDDTL